MKKVILFSNGKLGRTIRKIIEGIKEVSIVIHVTEDSSERYESKFIFDSKKDKNLEFLSHYEFDYIIVFNWKYKFSSHIVKEYDIFNIHPSLLPEYRGALPIVFQLLNKEARSGVTIHKMDENFDSGPIYYQEDFILVKGDNYTTMTIKIMVIVKKLLKKLLYELNQNNKLEIIEQNESASSYYGYKELSLYKITGETTYSEFLMVSGILKNKFPLLFNINGVNRKVISFSLEQTTLNQHKFCLADQTIYICTTGIFEVGKLDELKGVTYEK
ncbi:formyltransferase family protein [Bacillus mobilis]|uniref:formyltransferase family protein n=1 Tax=Bacillus mobilis TaxID=2026190 RepID=UPI002E1A3582|nr:formyltransferase family protein [Bacillus mobilis]